jgi:hypothetical protein
MILVFDDVLPDPAAYRAQALAQPFGTVQTGEELWHGIAPIQDPALPEALAARVPGAQVHLTFLRQSPEGQAEPNFIHSDEGMGQLTAILYLNPDPPAGDGTTFWRYVPTGAIAGSARELPTDAAVWEPWRTVAAKFNRLIVFDAWYFHSRAIEDNYGDAECARLVQIAFGTQPC